MLQIYRERRMITIRVQAKNLSKVYGDYAAVNGISLQIKTGSLTAILGPNGAGKTTIIKLLTGQLTPSTGTITYQVGTKLGVVFQSSVLDADLTVIENLKFRAKQYQHVTLTKITELIQQLGIQNFTNQRYGTLSGGQKRRVDIARSLLNEPDILFLDEPTTGLDIQTRTVIWQLLHQLQMTRHLTIVLTTHYLDEADSADNIYVVDHGKVIGHGTASELKQHYAQRKLKLTLTPEALPDVMAQLVENSYQITGNVITIIPESVQAALVFLQRWQSVISDFDYQPGTMDDAFMTLTGKEMR